jgi:serine/threonine-protein kinase
MAPEQLSGKGVSVKSDIYSLGLVLYELFTGKKAFAATTLEELIHQHETSAPTSISEHVKEVDPLVERVILRCLERDPAARPASAAQVAAALPGGDPLAAAIAAGETPSPEMVAAAPKEGALKPAVAAGLLAAIIVVFGYVILFSKTVKLNNVVPMEKPPEVLAERAGNIVKRLGYDSTPIDRAYGFNLDTSPFQYASENNALPDLRERLSTGRPAALFFWFRQSPRYLETVSDSNVYPGDPPMDVSGMATVNLDLLGRLIGFEAVPPQVDDRQGPAPSVDWSILFAEAGFDVASFKQTESRWTPPMGYDARAAWEGVYPDQPDIPIRIEAAAYRGRPVYFQIITPWDRPGRDVPFQLSKGEKIAGAILAALFVVGIIGAVLIARRNLRLERGDRKGAFKIALFVFSAVMMGLIIGADHVPTIGGELDVLYGAVAWALFRSALIWVIYIALEPYVRRRWPRLIISWSRLLAGGFRDPMVGRDISVGGLFGLAHTFIIYLMWQSSEWFGSPVAPNSAANPNTHGLQALLSDLLGHSVVTSFFLGLAHLFLLLLFYSLLRRLWLAAAVLWLIHTSVMGFAFATTGGWFLWIGPALIATILVIAVTRFGLLTLVSAHLFFTLSFHYPITSDFSSWYGGTTIFVLIILGSLIAYGFYTSLAGQPLLRGGLPQD